MAAISNLPTVAMLSSRRLIHEASPDSKQCSSPQHSAPRIRHDCCGRQARTRHMGHGRLTVGAAGLFALPQRRRRRAKGYVSRRTTRATGTGGTTGDNLSAMDLTTLRRRIAGLQALDEAAWREIPSTDVAPLARRWHSLTPIGDGSSRLCLFGGRCALSGRMLADTWLLEMPADVKEPARWTQLEALGLQPPGRAHHDAAVVDGRWLVVHGGLRDEGHRSNDTWRLDLTSSMPTWERIGTRLSPSPDPRYHHTFVATESGKLVLFGGHDWRRAPLNDAWVLDASGSPEIDEMEWRCIEADLKPESRAYHSAIAMGQWMIVCGGELLSGDADATIWALDVKHESWSRTEAEFAGGGRMRHAACCLEGGPGSEGVLAICGGHGVSPAVSRASRCLLLHVSGAGGLDSCLGQASPVSEQIYSQQEGDEELYVTSLGICRRDAVLFSLSSGHLVLFGGNDGTLVDQFGDGFHQNGCDATLIADAANGGASGVGAWRAITRGALDATDMGCAVAANAVASEVVVADCHPSSMENSLTGDPERDFIRLRALRLASGSDTTAQSVS